MADGEFIGPGGIVNVRQTILTADQSPTGTVINGAPNANQQQWSTIKTSPVAVSATGSTAATSTSFYPTYEWKVEEVPPAAIVPPQPTKKGKRAQQQLQQQQAAAAAAAAIPTMSVPFSQVDIKPLPQAVIAQCSNSWSSTTANAVATLASPAEAAAGSNANWATVKWENGTTIQLPKQTTLNTAGLHFISAPALQAAAAATTATPQAAPSASGGGAGGGPNSGINVVIHGGRKTGTIIETFKCEVCNQIFASMGGLQTHVSQVHEAGSRGRTGKKGGFSASTLHCEYKYSGMSLADSITGVAANINQQQPATIIATPSGGGGAGGGGVPTLSGNFLGGGAALGGAGGAQVLAGGGAGGGNINIQPVGVLPHNAAGNLIVTTAAAKAMGGNLSKSNKKEKRRNWQCDVCHNRFSRKDHLAKHVSAVHEKVRPFECNICGQKFSQKHHLKAHSVARHEEDKLIAKAFACQQCPKRFSRNDHLERHIESVHEKRKAFECAVCAHQVNIPYNNFKPESGTGNNLPFSVCKKTPPVETHPGSACQSQALRMPPVRSELFATSPPGSSHHVSPSTTCSRRGRRHKDLRLCHLLPQVQTQGPPEEAR